MSMNQRCGRGIIFVLFVAQGLMAPVLLFGDFGFDLPGRFGDIEDYVLLWGVFLLAAVVQFVVEIKYRCTTILTFHSVGVFIVLGILAFQERRLLMSLF